VISFFGGFLQLLKVKQQKMPVYANSTLSNGFLFGAVFEDAAPGTESGDDVALISTTTSNVVVSDGGRRRHGRNGEQNLVRRPSVEEYTSAEGFNMYDYVSSLSPSNDIRRPSHEAHLYCACDWHLRQRRLSSRQL